MSDEQGQPPAYQQETDDIVQVVYQSNQNGALVGVESALLSYYDPQLQGYAAGPAADEAVSAGMVGTSSLQQLSRAASTLPSVAEESSSGTGCPAELASGQPVEPSNGHADELASLRSISQPNEVGFGFASNLYQDQQAASYEQEQYYQSPDAQAIYSTVNRVPHRSIEAPSSKYDYSEQRDEQFSSYKQNESLLLDSEQSDGDLHLSPNEKTEIEGEGEEEDDNQDDDLSEILSRHKQGAAESGSFRAAKFKKKLGLSYSSNETDLEAHRQKLLESQEANNQLDSRQQEKFKRTHSVSFNVSTGRSVRHSVDIRSLPSYLSVKRASIVDVAKGAMSSLMQSFGSGAGSLSGQSAARRNSSPPAEEEPIFEEPIAPTLSLGQRVAMVRNSGAEFGTVGWIGQLPEVDDDWIVGVIFDNMIGNCDGEHNGVRYFYARMNYAMFVPLAALTKTDNYIGRPETGTMLSRMSVSLKPGQLISIQRSNIRLQHCFLNAPHQRVGHDVRAVSNRLHCQCHNCGPCAHLTKQGRVSALHAFGAHHAPNKKNSLAHAAVEILAHHHHHYHEEEHSKKRQEENQFGDNSAHACNFVRYSCCQQTGTPGHDLGADCGMVRPELLDNLIHAPKAPHRRSRPRRRRHQQVGKLIEAQQLAITNDSNFSTLDTVATMDTIQSSQTADDRSRRSSFSSGTYSGDSSRSSSPSNSYQQQQMTAGVYQQQHLLEQQTNYVATYDSSGVYQPTNVYSTLDTQMSLLEQRRYVSGENYAPSRSSDGQYQPRRSLGSSIRRCFGCLVGRQGRYRPNKRQHKRRKMSARNRAIEYRRKQSTFVPSTLAKPQEDFASHGLLVPPAGSQINFQNSDYSSGSGTPSPRGSPGRQEVGLHDGSMFIEHNAPGYNHQLKSTSKDSAGINLDDYTFSDAGSNGKKQICSYSSTLTDLGYFETCTSNSNDTLKQIVDSTINEEVAPLEPIASNPDFAAISPVLSCDATSEPGDQIEVSSPTVTEEDLSQHLAGLSIEKSQSDDQVQD